MAPTAKRASYISLALLFDVLFVGPIFFVCIALWVLAREELLSLEAFNTASAVLYTGQWIYHAVVSPRLAWRSPGERMVGYSKTKQLTNPVGRNRWFLFVAAGFGLFLAAGNSLNAAEVVAGWPDFMSSGRGSLLEQPSVEVMSRLLYGVVLVSVWLAVSMGIAAGEPVAYATAIFFGVFNLFANAVTGQSIPVFFWLGAVSMFATCALAYQPLEGGSVLVDLGGKTEHPGGEADSTYSQSSARTTGRAALVWFLIGSAAVIGYQLLSSPHTAFNPFTPLLSLLAVTALGVAHLLHQKRSWGPMSVMAKAAGGVAGCVAGTTIAAVAVPPEGPIPLAEVSLPGLSIALPAGTPPPITDYYSMGEVRSDAPGGHPGVVGLDWSLSEPVTEQDLEPLMKMTAEAIGAQFEPKEKAAFPVGSAAGPSITGVMVRKGVRIWMTIFECGKQRMMTLASMLRFREAETLHREILASVVCTPTEQAEELAIPPLPIVVDDPEEWGLHRTTGMQVWLLGPGPTAFLFRPFTPSQAPNAMEYIATSLLNDVATTLEFGLPTPVPGPDGPVDIVTGEMVANGKRSWPSARILHCDDRAVSILLMHFAADPEWVREGNRELLAIRCAEPGESPSSFAPTE